MKILFTTFQVITLTGIENEGIKALFTQVRSTTSQTFENRKYSINFNSIMFMY